MLEVGDLCCVNKAIHGPGHWFKAMRDVPIICTEVTMTDSGILWCHFVAPHEMCLLFLMESEVSVVSAFKDAEEIDD